MPATPASAIAIRLFANEAAIRAEFAGPVLVWEAAKPSQSESILKTRAGFEYGDTGGGEPLVFRVEKRPKKMDAFPMGITLGHADNNDIVLADPTVSRFHAYIPLDPTGRTWKLVDADSRHGTWVDETRAEANQPVPLRSGAGLRLGQAALRFFLTDDFIHYLRTGT